MNIYVVTETEANTQLIKRVLPQDLLDGVSFVAAGGPYAVVSMARSLVVRRRTPVAVVFDVHSRAPELARERRQEAEEALSYVAGGVPTRVIVAVPTLVEELTGRVDMEDAPVVQELTAFLRFVRQSAPELTAAGNA